ncbi:hypothetical protein L6452_37152 [Arctium lappa]|uniref:Uncharacterized protein n=1 Tax=Arctium lappa TaxID=4217 RepID=A0ACB8Y384_ARCLA|nr:hypothetical protein L6452_37152 [Arctium lappa]
MDEVHWPRRVSLETNRLITLTPASPLHPLNSISASTAMQFKNTMETAVDVDQEDNMKLSDLVRRISKSAGERVEASNAENDDEGINND